MSFYTIHELEAEAKKCTRCRLCETRTNVVLGAGPYSAKIMLVGEGPGATEDRTKIPFSGSAGKFLNELLHCAGTRRGEVRITNAVLCRPPKNRTPLPDEVETCRPFLESQVSIIKPKLVVALGRTAARALLGKEVSIGEEHGKLLDCTYAKTRFKLFLTYHPAAGLYSARTKTELQNDFAKFRKILRDLELLIE